MKSRTGFSGIYPMLYAFFDRQGGIDRAAMRRQVEAIVAGGAHGVGVLGLATEVNKLSFGERRQLLDWTAEDLAGRSPLAVTVAEVSVGGQVEFAAAAKAAGASWVILQTPPVTGAPEMEVIRFFGAVADRAELPIGLQIAPQFLGTRLSGRSLLELRRQHPNVSLLKLEAPPLEIEQIVAETDDQFDIFNGRAGMDLADSLLAGCVGSIPGAEAFDVLVRVFDLYQAADPQSRASAEHLYGEVLPLLAFLEHGIEHFLAYGKTLMSRRLGLGDIHQRSPHAVRTPLGMTLLESKAKDLKRLP